MWEIIIWLVKAAVVVLLILCGLLIVGWTIGFGAVLGVFIGTFIAIKNYFVSINTKITNKPIKWLMNISLGICSIGIFAALGMIVYMYVL